MYMQIQSGKIIEFAISYPADSLFQANLQNISQLVLTGFVIRMTRDQTRAKNEEWKQSMFIMNDASV